MTESEFLALYDQIVRTIEAQADHWFDDLDVEVEAVRNGAVLTLDFDSGVSIIINSQASLQEIWVAAPQGGFHYTLRDGTWCDTRGGSELSEALSHVCSAAAGRSLHVSL